MKKADNEIIRWTAAGPATAKIASGRSISRMAVVGLPISFAILFAIHHFIPALFIVHTLAQDVAVMAGFCAILFIVGLVEIRRHLGKSISHVYTISDRSLRVLTISRDRPLIGFRWKCIIGWQAQKDGTPGFPTEVALIFRNQPPKRIPLPSDGTAAVILEEIARHAPERPDIDFAAELQSWTPGGKTSLLLLCALIVLYFALLFLIHDGKQFVQTVTLGGFMIGGIVAGPGMPWALYAHYVEKRKWPICLTVGFHINVIFLIVAMMVLGLRLTAHR